jgi:hypothetical protein
MHGRGTQDAAQGYEYVVEKFRHVAVTTLY